MNNTQRKQALKKIFEANSYLIAENVDVKSITEFWKVMIHEVNAANVRHLVDQGYSDTEIHKMTGMYYTKVQKYINNYQAESSVHIKPMHIELSANDNAYRLNGRKDFWNVPCNPITGYRVKPINGNTALKVKEEFFNESKPGDWS